MGIETGDSYELLTILLHVGTLIPIVVVFWHEWWGMLRHPILNLKLWGMLILASMPALAAHVLGLDDGFETGWFLGAAFAITGLLLLLTELVSGRRGKGKGLNRPGWLQALVMGIFQSFALLPGISRSGSTITGGIFSGMDRKAAAKFSFMMSAPAVAGSLLLEGKAALENGLFDALKPMLVPVIVGVLVACVSGYLAIRFMLNLINRISLGWFALYVALIGLAYLVLQLSGSSLVPAFVQTVAAAPVG